MVADFERRFIMDMNSVITAIGSVGFPIVACCGLFYLYNETITKITNTLDLLNKSIELIADELKKDKGADE
jgi:hypothetical protein